MCLWIEAGFAKARKHQEAPLRFLASSRFSVVFREKLPAGEQLVLIFSTISFLFFPELSAGAALIPHSP
jgi:hypothetical protein